MNSLFFGEFSVVRVSYVIFTFCHEIAKERDCYGFNVGIFSERPSRSLEEVEK